MITLTDPKKATRRWTDDSRNISLNKTMPDLNDTDSYPHDALARLKVIKQ